MGLEPVRRFFPHSNLSQTTVVSAQDKSQRASHEIFSKLISTLSALIHLDSEPPKVPFFCGSWRVRFAVRTFWHNLPPFKVRGKITIYHFHNAFASKSHLLIAIRARNRENSGRTWVQHPAAWQQNIRDQQTANPN
jgi:hypothetical protein